MIQIIDWCTARVRRTIGNAVQRSTWRNSVQWSTSRDRVLPSEMGILVLTAMLLAIAASTASYVVAQDDSLDRASAEKLVQETFLQIAGSRELKLTERPDGYADFQIQAAAKEMKCVGKLFGDAPMGQRSLFISMHGGGGAPAKVNDQQWKNQIRLYQPSEGYYVAPRAPTNTWNLWHEPHIDALFARMIEDFIATKGVHPDRVYLMGYSAGGDGVYQLAPRMADRFAAACMMAGHPNGVAADGLFNLPFRIYMGGKDAAYKRNAVAKQWKTKLADLQKERGGYPHKVTIYPDFGHWMNRKDAEAVPWMATQTRNDWPKRVIWGETGIRSDRFYWLGGISQGTIHASVDGQAISLAGVGKQETTLWLRDQLIDLDLPIKVVSDGQVVYEGLVPRTVAAIQQSLQQRLDPSQAATAMIQLK